MPGIGSIFAAYNLLIILNSSKGHKKELLNLAKIYIDNAKCSGYNDSFIFKLAIFYDICSKANILPEVKIKEFSMILKGLTLDHYSLNIGISNTVMNSNQIYNLIIRK